MKKNVFVNPNDYVLFSILENLKTLNLDSYTKKSIENLINYLDNKMFKSIYNSNSLDIKEKKMLIEFVFENDSFNFINNRV